MHSDSRTFKGWLWGLAAATAYSALQGFQASMHIAGVGFVTLFVMELPVWWFWVGAAIPVSKVARRFRLGSSNLVRYLLVHGCVAFVLGFAWNVFVQAARIPLVVSMRAVGMLTPAGRAYLSSTEPLVSRVLSAWEFYLAFPVLMYAGILTLDYALTYQRALHERTLREQELLTLVAESHLNALRSQLNPHFLFNTLNTVSGLMGSDVPLARSVLARLGELLHANLREEDEQETTLSRELALLRSYVDIQRARFSDRLRVNVAASEEASEGYVPRFVLQPFVENSIQHGMSRDAALTVSVNAGIQGGVLVITIKDDGIGQREGDELVARIGIGNTRTRIEKLYPNVGDLRTRGTTDGFEVTIRLPFRRSASTAM